MLALPVLHCNCMEIRRGEGVFRKIQNHVAQAVLILVQMISTRLGGWMGGGGGVRYRWEIQQAAHYILNDTIVPSLV